MEQSLMCPWKCGRKVHLSKSFGKELWSIWHNCKVVGDIMTNEVYNQFKLMEDWNSWIGGNDD